MLITPYTFQQVLSLNVLVKKHIYWFIRMFSEYFNSCSIQFSRSVVSDSVIPWAATCQASLSITNSCTSV